MHGMYLEDLECFRDSNEAGQGFVIWWDKEHVGKGGQLQRHGLDS